MAIIITGITGFLGNHLAEELLKKHAPDKNVIAVIRDRERALGLDYIRNLKRDFQMGLWLGEGDIELVNLGLEEDITSVVCSQVEEIWHLAASTSFKERNRESTFRINVGGTENIINLAKQCPKLKRLCYVGTAYTYGFEEGRVYENPWAPYTRWKNPYEESKCSSEALAREAAKNLPVVIFKPSIITGHSQTGIAHSKKMIYGVFLGLLATRDVALKRTPPQEETVDLREIHDGPIRLYGMAGSRKNLIPIDTVCEMMMTIAERDDAVGEAFHITHPESTTSKDVIDAIQQAIRVTGMEWDLTVNRSEMSPLERFANTCISDYNAYVERDEPIFDMTNTMKFLPGFDYGSMNRATLDFMFSAYMRQYQLV